MNESWYARLAAPATFVLTAVTGGPLRKVLAACGTFMAALVFGVHANGNPQSDNLDYSPGWHVSLIGWVLFAITALYVVSIVRHRHPVEEPHPTAPTATYEREPRTWEQVTRVPVVPQKVAEAPVRPTQRLSLENPVKQSVPRPRRAPKPPQVEDHGGYVITDRRRFAEDDW